MKRICAAYLDTRKKYFEPPHDKTNKIIFAPSEDSDQPEHPPSLTRVFAVRSVGSLGPNVASGGPKDSDQTWWMPRLICLRWAHRSFCSFCHAAAQFSSENIAYGIVTNLHMRN